MPERLRMPCGCPHARKISDDLKWGKHLGGTHDDHVGLQKVSIHEHSRHNHERIPAGPDMNVHGQAHQKIKNINPNLQKEVKKYNTG